MPALFASYDPEQRAEGDLFDIRTRLAISLIVSGLAIWLSGTAPLLALGLCTLIYVLFTGHWKVIVVTYLAVSLMMALSMGIIWVSFMIGEACVAGTAWEKSVAMLKPAMLGNFHTPFLRMIPSINVLLAIGMNFSVQRFVGAMKSVRLPRVLFLPLMVFCRFVPEFVDVIRQLRDAVRMRGFAITFGSIFAHPVQTLRLTFIPLTVRTLRMADHLSVAAEMKRVGYAKRPTQLRRLHFRMRDSIALIVTILLTFGFVAWQKAVPATPYGPAAMKSMKNQEAQSQSTEAAAPQEAPTPTTEEGTP